MSTYLFIQESPPGFEHQPSKAVLQSLAGCQASSSQKVEGITIIFCKENTYGSSLAIRFRESLRDFNFPSQPYEIL